MRIAAVAAMLIAAHPADAAVRALFVGIDTYAHAGPGIKNLTGAVADLGLVKATLAARYGLVLDIKADGCASSNRVSTTLTNACASRAAILSALVKQIAASAAGDTLIFFYAGHGATAADRSQEQAHGIHGTLVPHDARGGGVADIYDRELKLLIDDASARGVNVWTIFDSCNAGTATRDVGGVRSRRADPAPPTSPPPLIRPPAASAPVRGYTVHFGAAQDNEDAKEIRDADGVWHGAFTRAFVAAVAGLPTPTYRDLITEIRRTIAGTSQSPQAEGSLSTPVLGVATPPVRLFDAEAKGLTLDMAGGSIAGVTIGSTYGVFASDPRGAPLAMAVVDSVAAGSATLRLDKPLAEGRTWRALELVHAYGADAVRLRIDGAPELAATLAGLDGIAVTDRDPRYVLSVTGDVAQLARPDGSAVGGPLRRAAPDFATQLRERLRRIANADQLLGLRNDRGKALGEILIRRACADPSDCTDLETLDGATLVPGGEAIVVAVRNISNRDLHPYAFYVDADYGILRLMPPTGARDPALRPGAVLTAPRLRTSGSGRDEIVLVMSDTPLDLASLEQAAVRDVLPPTRDPLAQLLRAARSGRASRDIPRVGTWGATAVPLRRVAPK